MRRWWRRWRRTLLMGYLALLLIAHVVQWLRPVDEGPVACCALEVRAVDGERLLDEHIRLAYQDISVKPGSAGVSNGLPMVLLHGSPGDADNFSRLARLLSERRLIIPDLPGFGYSTRDIPDYSFKAHARYVLKLLDQLRIERAHVVGFSMGGGVALYLNELAPDRIASITMLSAIGAQEMELLGDYHLNHAVHGLQLGAFWLLREGLPLTPRAYDRDITVAYCRNFYDSDQRPLRALMLQYQGPMQIIHGRNDFLVPVEAAIEHHRLVPQSELKLLDDDHFMVFMRPEVLAPLLQDFAARAETGQAAMRAAADPARIAASQQPFDPRNLPKFIGVTAIVVTLLLAAATLVSEDLTCITAGVMAAQGRIGFLLASFACFLGIFIGDLLLFLAGRWLGRAALERAPVKWFVKRQDVERSSDWFARQGAKVIFASRFLPGARLPTYFAAGALKTSFWRFALYFAIACAVWTPILVALAMWLGKEAVESAFGGRRGLLFKIIVVGIPLLLLLRMALQCATWKGRRLLLSSWRRMTRWEFWPPYVFYPPVLVYIAWLMMKHRSLTLFTAANPAIPGGGFIGESKAEILRGLAGVGANSDAEFMPKWELINASLPIEMRVQRARSFVVEYPIVLKPDAGQRGSGVAVVKSESEMEHYLRTATVDTLIQEYVGGEEFGVFYYRYPDESHGRIFAITEKRFPSVLGDGRNTLEQLILNDARAVCMARFHLNKYAGRLWDVPRAGERIQLVELGTHARGSLFLDGGWVGTEALQEAIDRVCQGYDGFYFGRFDIRTPSIEDFQQGRNFKVIELNGVTSEATSIYDPKNSLLVAYRVLFAQWRIAFEIGAQNRRRGAAPATARTLLRWLVNYSEQSQSHL